MQRTEWICAFPAQRRAPIRRQRFRQDQQAVKRIGKTQTRRDPERQPRIHAAQQSAERGAEDKSGPERRADLAEHRGAPFRRRDIGDVGKRRRDARRGDAGDHPADEQPGQATAPAPSTHSPARGQSSTAAPRAAGRTGPTDRREPARRKTASRPMRYRTGRRSARPLAVSLSTKLSTSLGRTGMTRPSAKRVEQDGDEDEGHRRTAHRRHFDDALGPPFAHDGRLRLWANGLAFSRSAIRTGVPGSSKYSRKELTR